jgi:hypothetical protein
MWIKLDNGYGSEGVYCLNDFKVNYKQNQYHFQVSSVQLCLLFFTLKNLKCPVFSFQKSGHPILYWTFQTPNKFRLEAIVVLSKMSWHAEGNVIWPGFENSSYLVAWIFLRAWYWRIFFSHNLLLGSEYLSLKRLNINLKEEDGI